MEVSKMSGYPCSSCHMLPGELHKPDCANMRDTLLKRDVLKDRRAEFEAQAGQTNTKKDTNPKDAIGISKVPMSTIPAPVMAELGVAMLEGALKYGRHNYREAGVRASVYYDATVARHMQQWWEGEDEDKDTCDKDEHGEPIPGTGLSHITKAIASLTVLRDSMIRGNWIDDRPPRTKDGWMDKLNAKVKGLLKKYPNPVPSYTEKPLKKAA